MEIDKSDIEWLLMMIVMLLQSSPITINLNTGKKKPSKKRKPRKHKR